MKSLNTLTAVTKVPKAQSLTDGWRWKDQSGCNNQGSWNSCFSCWRKHLLHEMSDMLAVIYDDCLGTVTFQFQIYSPFTSIEACATD